MKYIYIYIFNHLCLFLSFLFQTPKHLSPDVWIFLGLSYSGVCGGYVVHLVLWLPRATQGCLQGDSLNILDADVAMGKLCTTCADRGIMRHVSKES